MPSLATYAIGVVAVMSQFALAQCSISAAGGVNAVQDGETLYFPSSSTSIFSRAVTISGCEPTTSDADGSAITTDSFVAQLVDPDGNTYECDTNPADESFPLNGQDITTTFYCSGVTTGSMEAGQWLFLTFDTYAELSDEATFQVTHTEATTTVTSIIPSATTKVIELKFPDACCPNKILSKREQNLLRFEERDPRENMLLGRFDRRDVPTTTVYQTIKTGTAYAPTATLSPLLVCPIFGGSLLTTFIKSELALYQSLHGGHVLVVCAGTSVYY